WSEFRDALARWKMPPRRFEYRDIDSVQRYQVAALVPVRRGSEWVAWRTLDELPHGFASAVRTVPTEAAPRDSESPRGTATFAHPLGITDALRQRYHIGPLTSAGDPRPFHIVFDPKDWDRARAMNAPGQSGSPASAHFSDLAKLWAVGEDLTLVFS